MIAFAGMVVRTLGAQAPARRTRPSSAPTGTSRRSSRRAPCIKKPAQVRRVRGDEEPRARREGEHLHRQPDPQGPGAPRGAAAGPASPVLRRRRRGGHREHREARRQDHPQRGSQGGARHHAGAGRGRGSSARRSTPTTSRSVGKDPGQIHITKEDESLIRSIAANPDAYQKLIKSMAPGDTRARGGEGGDTPPARRRAADRPPGRDEAQGRHQRLPRRRPRRRQVGDAEVRSPGRARGGCSPRARARRRRGCRRR